MIDLNSIQGSSKSFWTRPEGTTAKVMVGAGVAAALYLIHTYDVLGKLIQIAQDAIHLTILGVVLAGLWLLLTAERPRTLITLAFRLLARAITSFFITLDPIGIIKEAIAEMQRYRKKIADARDKVVAVKVSLERDIKVMTKEMGGALELAHAAKKSQDGEGMGAHAIIASRKRRSIDNTRDMLANIERAEATMSRVLKHVDNRILVAEEEAKDLERQFRAARSYKAATGAAKKAMGGSDLIRMKDDAADYVRSFYDAQLGEMESLTAMLDFDKSLDLQEIAFREDGLRQLEQVEQLIAQLEAPTQTIQIAGINPVGLLEQGAVAQPEESRWAEHVRKPRA